MIPATRLTRVSKKIKNEKGMTLVEVLIVLLFISLIVGLVSVIYISSSRTSDSIIDITRSQIDARLAAYRISKDIREASDLIQAEDDRISFLSNTDIDEDFEEITYFLSSTNGYYTLNRSIDGGSSKIVITHLVDNKIFIYFSEMGAPEGGLATPVSSGDLENIKLIELNISIDQSGAESLRTMDLDTLIALRNRI